MELHIRYRQHESTVEDVDLLTNLTSQLEETAWARKRVAGEWGKFGGVQGLT